MATSRRWPTSAASTTALQHTPGGGRRVTADPRPGGDAALITLTPTTSPQDEGTKQLLTRLRDHVVPDAMAGSDVVVKVGGITAADVDQTEQHPARLPAFIVAVIVLALLLLLAVFRSVVIAAQAAVSNLLSIIAAYGVVAYAAQGGWFGDLFGITTPTPIPAFIPMMMFAILFGLSMDYEVFLLSRIREEYLRTARQRVGRRRRARVHGQGDHRRRADHGRRLRRLHPRRPDLPQDHRDRHGRGRRHRRRASSGSCSSRRRCSCFGDKNWWIPRWLDRLIPTLDIEGTNTQPDSGPEPAPTRALENA